MNRKLIEHLYRHKFQLEDAVQHLKNIKDFNSEEDMRVHKLDLNSAKARLAFVNETLDIVFVFNEATT